MRRIRRGERGQTIVEFAIICSVLMILTVGLVDAGRAFYQYNALSTAARYAARWGGVVGGTCNPQSAVSKSNGDWCNQSSTSSTFWTIPGNKPLQSIGTSCPSTYNSGFTGYYTASTYKGTTTIAGAVAQRFDSDYLNKSKTVGDATPGFDLTQLKICIQLPTSSTSGTSAWSYLAGDSVTVYLYYPFQPVSALFGRITLNLVASSQYEVE